MPAYAYASGEKDRIRQFLDEKKADILDRIRSGGARLQDCTVERFVSILVHLAPKTGVLAELLTEYRIINNDANKRYMRDYLQGLKNAEAPAWPGVRADQSRESEDSITGLFSDLDDAATNAAKRAGIKTGPLFTGTLAAGPYYHKTVPGSAGVAVDGSARRMVTLFYQLHGGEYYLVAWGVHAGKTRDGKAAVYRVREAVPECALRPGNILRPPDK